MSYIEIQLKKCKVYLTQDEINRLLLSDLEIFKKALARGKAFTRSQDKRQQFEAKWSEHDGQSLNFIQ